MMCIFLDRPTSRTHKLPRVAPPLEGGTLGVVLGGVMGDFQDSPTSRTRNLPRVAPPREGGTLVVVSDGVG